MPLPTNSNSLCRRPRPHALVPFSLLVETQSGVEEAGRAKVGGRFRWKPTCSESRLQFPIPLSITSEIGCFCAVESALRCVLSPLPSF